MRPPLGDILIWEVEGYTHDMDGIRNAFVGCKMPFKTTSRSAIQTLEAATRLTLLPSEFVVPVTEDREKAIVSIKAQLRYDGALTCDIVDVDTVTWFKHDGTVIVASSNRVREGQIWSKVRDRSATYNAKEIGYAIANALRKAAHGYLLRRVGGMYYIPQLYVPRVGTMLRAITAVADASPHLVFSYQLISVTDVRRNRAAMQSMIDGRLTAQVRKRIQESDRVMQRSDRVYRLGKITITKQRKKVRRLQLEVDAREREIGAELTESRRALRAYWRRIIKWMSAIEKEKLQ